MRAFPLRIAYFWGTICLKAWMNRLKTLSGKHCRILLSFSSRFLSDLTFRKWHKHQLMVHLNGTHTIAGQFTKTSLSCVYHFKRRKHSIALDLLNIALFSDENREKSQVIWKMLGNLRRNYSTSLSSWRLFSSTSSRYDKHKWVELICRDWLSSAPLWISLWWLPSIWSKFLLLKMPSSRGGWRHWRMLDGSEISKAIRTEQGHRAGAGWGT